INGKTGYIHKKHVTIVNTKPKPEVVVANKSPTNVREGASTKSNVLTKIPRGTILSVQTFSKNWYSYTAMINGKRQTGYIHKKHVKKTITTNYNLTLDKAVQLQMTVARPKPQTDRYFGYVFKKY